MARCPVLPPHPVGEKPRDDIKPEVQAFGMFLKELVIEIIQESPKTPGQQHNNCFGEPVSVQVPKPTWPNGYDWAHVVKRPAGFRTDTLPKGCRNNTRRNCKRSSH